MPLQTKNNSATNLSPSAVERVKQSLQQIPGSEPLVHFIDEAPSHGIKPELALLAAAGFLPIIGDLGDVFTVPEAIAAARAVLDLIEQNIK